VVEPPAIIDPPAAVEAAADMVEVVSVEDLAMAEGPLMVATSVTPTVLVLGTSALPISFNITSHPILRFELYNPDKPTKKIFLFVASSLFHPAIEECAARIWTRLHRRLCTTAP